jgi:hypothetical protein
MSKNVRFGQADESPKDWSWSAHSSFSSLEETTDYQERIMLPPKMPVRKTSCDPTMKRPGDHSSDNDVEEEEAPLHDTITPKAAPSILRRKSRYGSSRQDATDFGDHSSSSSSIELPVPTMKESSSTMHKLPPRPRDKRWRIRDIRSPSDDSLQWVRKEATEENKAAKIVREMEICWERVVSDHPATQRSGSASAIVVKSTNETWDNE